MLKIVVRKLFALLLLSLLLPAAMADEKVRFLLPTVRELPSFAAFLLADTEGYYKQEGLDVEFLAGKGGVDVAKQLGAGNADIGEAMGDTSIIVRGNGVPVKTVALLGGGGLMQLAVRESAGVTKLEQLKGKKISTVAFTDTTFYALLGMLGSVGLKQGDVDAQAVGSRGAVQMLLSGDVDACACIPEQLVTITDAGVKIRIFPSSEHMPAMAQAILASDAMIKSRPETVRKFIRASMKGVALLRDTPAKAAALYVKAVPSYEGQEKFFEQAFTLYSKNVYAVPQKQRGAVDPERLAALQDMYVAQGVVRNKAPLADLYTNALVLDK